MSIDTCLLITVCLHQKAGFYLCNVPIPILSMVRSSGVRPSPAEASTPISRSFGGSDMYEATREVLGASSDHRPDIGREGVAMVFQRAYI